MSRQAPPAPWWAPALPVASWTAALATGLINPTTAQIAMGSASVVMLAVWIELTRAERAAQDAEEQEQEDNQEDSPTTP